MTGVRNFHQGGVTYDLTVGKLHTYYVLAGTASVLVHNCGGAGPESTVTNLPEAVATKPLKPAQAESVWKDFLGEGPYTNIHPRTGVPDPSRLVSADGRRSIRMGDHEMNSKPTKFHFHMETWDWVAPSNEWIVGNTMVRVPLGLK